MVARKGTRWGRVAIVLTVALLLAGCIGTDRGGESTASGEEDLEADDADQGRQQRQQRQASQPAPGQEQPEQPTPVELTYEGAFGTGSTACVYVMVGGTCQGASVTGSELGFPLDEGGPVTSINVTLTWDAVSPAMEELRLGVSWSCDDSTCDGFEYVDGSSPISLSIDAIQDPEPVVWAWLPSPTDGPVWTFTHHEQPFVIEGEALVLS